MISFNLLTLRIILSHYLFQECFHRLKSEYGTEATANNNLGLSGLFVVIQLLCHVQLFATPWAMAYQASLSFTVSWGLLRFMLIESMALSNYFILCCPLLPLPSIFPSISIFSNESALHIRWPNYWSFSFSISSTNEYSEMISFRIDWLIWSPSCPRYSQESSSTTIQKHLQIESYFKRQNLRWIH